MANKSASYYRSGGYLWANLSTNYVWKGGIQNDHTVQSFKDAGVALSVFNADTDQDMDYYVSQYDNLKYICTNYPAKLLAKLKNAGK